MFAPLIDLGATVPVLATFAGVVWGILAVVLVFVCLLLILVILIQDPKGGGLTSAFGAGPGGDSVLGGARAQRDVTIWTSWLTLIFLVIVIAMVLFDPDKWQSAADQAAGSSVQPTGEPETGDAPVEPPTAEEPPEVPALAPPETGTDTDDGAAQAEPPTESKKSGQE